MKVENEKIQGVAPGNKSILPEHPIDPERIKKCRACGGESLWEKLALGEQAYSGVFLKPRQEVPKAPLTLVECQGCGLIQLDRSFDPAIMYGPTYGYRSGLNKSMVKHLQRKADQLRLFADLGPRGVVLDIGSSDGTFLKAFTDHDFSDELILIGFDPQAERFKEHYWGADAVSGFFSAKQFKGVKNRQADIITTIAMFYDIENPVGWSKEVASCLDVDGIWNIEMHYAPVMEFDAVCQEHATYYSMDTLKFVLRQAGLKVVQAEFNSVNGGSLSVIVRHHDHPEPELKTALDPFLWEDFIDKFHKVTGDIQRFLNAMKNQGKRVYGLGASTKGNVLLQAAGITPELMECIVDVNPDKHGCVTPGSNIPIISEEKARANPPDVYFVLPWHFRESILEREQAALSSGHSVDVVFPLPEFESVKIRGA